MKIMLNSLLNDRNKSLYWLSQQTKLPYPTLHRIANKPVTSISLGIAEKICIALNVTMNDLFILENPK